MVPGLAVCLDDLRLDVRPAMDRARVLGFRAIDVGAESGPLSPGELSGTGRRHLLRHLSDLGLRLASLRGPVAGPGYGDGAAGERRLDAMRGVVALASALRVPTVSTTLGDAVGGDAEAASGRVREALDALADHADRAGVTVTIETAGVPAGALCRLLADVNCPNLAACADAGAMLMQGDDPHALADVLAGRVRLSRGRDAVPGGPGAPGYEVALGEGRLDVPSFLAALQEAGFAGDIILSRTSGADPAADLVRARERFMRHLAGTGLS